MKIGMPPVGGVRFRFMLTGFLTKRVLILAWSKFVGLSFSILPLRRFSSASGIDFMTHTSDFFQIE
jgi:hypothetical protein